MSESAEGHSSCANQETSPPASPRSPPSCSSPRTWLPVQSHLHDSPKKDVRMEQDSQDRQSSPQSHFFEELFCTSHTSNTVIPLAGALMTTSTSQSDVVKQGYVRKLERNHRRYFVLRAGSHTGPSRLEWYKSWEKFIVMEKSAGKAALFGSNKQGVIYLRCCLGVSRSGSSKKGHTVALYAKDQTMVLVLEDEWEQEQWYLDIKTLMDEEQKDEEHREGLDEDDDGYCTLPPAAFFKEVWPVTVKPRGLGCSKPLAGESRLCLTAVSLVLVRVTACSDLPSVTIPLLSVRRFGHRDGSFFLELGRSAPNGPGEIWMEARGNPAAAQQIHEQVRETVKALRAVPDFSRSPTSNHNQLQTLLASKHCRPIYREKHVNVRPLGSRLGLPHKHPEAQTSPTKCYLERDKANPEFTLSAFRSHQSLKSETGYMEMNHHLMSVNIGRENDCRSPAEVTGDHCGVAACGVEGWEPGEEQRPGYMMMSPQMSHSSSVLPQDDYMTMASPRKHHCPVYSSPSSSLQTSFNSSSYDGYSPLHPSHHQTVELSPPRWTPTSVKQSETDAGQSQTSLGCSTRQQDDERLVQRRLRACTRATSYPLRGLDGSGMIAPFDTRGPGCTRPVLASPDSGSYPFTQLQATSERSVRRYRLSLCLPSCLQAED
ncbi:insulin receptor substrate 1-like [Centropristis striata]|uniref:insulin receptor substrate 1-like n=1 Tax=Centropristis striata TaxID=184440 RepID=UPI0027DF7EAF|nr:insulin receptor substrate 1-like [Centropristis striata]